MIWSLYKNYIRQRILPDTGGDLRDTAYWGNEIFCQMLIYLVPISIIALIPGVYMAFHTGLVLVGITDLLAFAGLTAILVSRSLTIGQRKIIFIGIFYVLSVVLIFYMIISGVGMLYLLALTVIIAIVYSVRAAYYSVLANAVICAFYAVVIHFGGDLSAGPDYTTAAWIAISSNLVFLSFACTKCLELLMAGMEATMRDKIIAKSAIKVLNNRLLLATSSARMGIWEWDIKSNHLLWDQGMHALYQTDERYGSVYDHWLSRLHPGDRDRTDMDIQNALQGIRDYDTEFRIIWDDYSIHHIRATGTIERGANGEVLRMIGTNWDITEEKIQQAKLSISEANLTAVIENTDANIYSLDTGFRYIMFNRVLEQSIKQAFDVDVKRGDRVFEFLESSAPDEAQEWKRIYMEALTGKSLKFEKEFTLGTHVSSTAFSITPIFKDNEVIGLSCYGVDITDLKNALLEIKKLNEGLELKVADRTAELENANKEFEAFSYSVSHDLRAPVRALIGFTKIIRDEYGYTFNEDVQEMFKYIEDSGKRMDAIIEDLFTLAKYGKDKMTFSAVDLNVLFHEVWDNLLFRSPHYALLSMAHMPTVYADRSKLQQVIVNILSNSIKYSSKRETPVVRIGYKEVDQALTIYVQDNGAGFDMSQYDRLFGAFQRLHCESEFEGTGVGLLISKKIIERHGGTIWAEGKVDEGTTFYFSLPVVQLGHSILDNSGLGIEKADIL